MMCLSGWLARIWHGLRGVPRGAMAVGLLLAALASGPVLAVQPDEILDDPALEERARDISAGLRCVVCRNESIDESNATLARDLRLLVRERLVAGDSDAEVVSFVVDRYGEYVLLRPTLTGSNLALWIAPVVILLVGGGLALAFIRRRANSPAPTEAALSPEEEARLKDLLKD
jgi:cytochrome c-type biogenesis protein CcmH